jgi:hypothetical protein
MECYEARPRLPVALAPCHHLSMTMTSEDRMFAEEWNQLDRMERSRLRRLVRMGRKIEEPQLARVATTYARRQVARPWIRFFWLWFVPGILFALGAAAQVHPIFVGVVLVLGAQAVWAQHNLRRTARTDA